MEKHAEWANKFLNTLMVSKRPDRMVGPAVKWTYGVRGNGVWFYCKLPSGRYFMVYKRYPASLRTQEARS